MSRLLGRKKSYREEEINNQDYEIEPFTAKWLSLGNDYPRMAYRRRTGEIRKSIHWGKENYLFLKYFFLLFSTKRKIFLTVLLWFMQEARQAIILFL